MIGRWAARLGTRIIARLLRRAHTDESLVKFVADVAYAMLLCVVVIASLERLGIKTTAAVAIIGAAGLAVGLALQGSLGNFAAGVMIMMFPGPTGSARPSSSPARPAPSNRCTSSPQPSHQRHAQGHRPQRAITATSIENLSALGTRRLEFQIVVQCGGDLEGAKAGLRRAVHEVPLSWPSRVGRHLSELAEGKATFMLHASVKTEDFAPPAPS